MKTKTQGHHHGGSSGQTCKTSVKCAGGGPDRLNQSSSDENVFVLSGASPLMCGLKESSLPEHAATHLKDPHLPVDTPPKP